MRIYIIGNDGIALCPTDRRVIAVDMRCAGVPGRETRGDRPRDRYGGRHSQTDHLTFLPGSREPGGASRLHYEGKVEIRHRSRGRFSPSLRIDSRKSGSH
jgi:hypothetical protein